MKKPVYADFIETRVFIEGVLFPYAKSITVMDGQNSVSCRIEVPPSVKLKAEEWTGATCHIFYANKRVFEKFGNADNTSPSDWPILFQGELVGTTSQKTVASENVSLEFTGHAKHFDQTILYFYDPNRENPANVTNQSMFLGNKEIEVDFDGVISRSTGILATLQDRIEALEDKDTDRNIAFTSIVMDILRQARDRHIAFHIFDDKFKLSTRFAAYTDPDIKEVLNLEMMRNLIDQQSQALDSNTPLTRILEIATEHMKYNWLHISQPQRRTSAYASMRGGIPTFDSSGVNVQAAVNSAIQQYRTRPSNITIMGESVSFPPGFDFRFRSISKEEFVRRTSQLIENNSLTAAEAIQELINLNIFVKEPSRSPENKVTDDVDLSLQAVQQEQEKDSDQEKIIELMEEDQRELINRDELNEFTVVPNMQFSQPPKCNVILPMNLTSYGITRSNMAEPTRLYGRAQFAPGGGDTLVEWYLAPSSQCYYYLNSDNVSKFNTAYQDFFEDMDLTDLTEDSGEEEDVTE